jgi:hypothetical protein
MCAPGDLFEMIRIFPYGMNGFFDLPHLIFIQPSDSPSVTLPISIKGFAVFCHFREFHQDLPWLEIFL